MYEWCMNDVYIARPPKIVIVLSVLLNWNKIVNQSPKVFYIVQRVSQCLPLVDLDSVVLIETCLHI